MASPTSRESFTRDSVPPQNGHFMLPSLVVIKESMCVNAAILTLPGIHAQGFFFPPSGLRAFIDELFTPATILTGEMWCHSDDRDFLHCSIVRDPVQEPTP